MRYLRPRQQLCEQPMRQRLDYDLYHIDDDLHHIDDYEHEHDDDHDDDHEHDQHNLDDRDNDHNGRADDDHHPGIRVYRRQHHYVSQLPFSVAVLGLLLSGRLLHGMRARDRDQPHL